MEKKTLSITMWAVQAELIQAAADKADVSVAEFIRARAIPGAAAVLGVEVPQLPSFEPPRFRRGVVSQAAEALGVSVEQFKTRAAHDVANKILDDLTAPGKSGERPAAAPPAYRYRAG